MIQIISVPTLLSKPYFKWGGWHNTGTWWKRSEEVVLKALCEAGAPIEKSADGLGRSPTSIAHRAYDTGLKIPAEWRDLITPKRKSASKGSLLQYPYIVNVRGEHQELLAVNALVPRGLPDFVRADVCQEIMLALWQKKITLEELRLDKSLMRGFMSGHRKANLEAGGYVLSLDQPMQDGRSWYDILPDTEHF